jgi:hypothetical protein
MYLSLFRFVKLWLVLFLVLLGPKPVRPAEPKVQILSPKTDDRVTQDQSAILVSGKVASQAARFSNVDIMLVLDTSGSTKDYSGADFAELSDLPPNYLHLPAQSSPQFSVSLGGRVVVGQPRYEQPPPINLRNSILAAEVVASRRLLTQLDPKTTRVGVITFNKDARLDQPLTHDFEEVRRLLVSIYKAGPNGGTNMVEGIRLGIKELHGLGASAKRTDAIKAMILLTDGAPSLPLGDGLRVNSADVALVINGARLAGKSGIKVHVFGLGEQALVHPEAAVGIAMESGGTYTPVHRPADVLALVENISVVGVEYIQIVNQTTGQKATNLRSAADGFFSSAVPVVEGRNQIDVFARASDGTTGRDTVTIYYQSGTQKSLDLEVFLEKERKLKLEVERLGRSQAEIQRDVERGREDSLRRPSQPPPPAEGPPR